MKRALSLFTVLLMVFALLCACSGAKEIEPAQDDETADNPYFDCWGEEFSIYQEGWPDKIAFGYESTSIYYELVDERLDEIRTNLNCGLTLNNTGSCDSLIRTSSASGFCDVDIFFGMAGREVPLLAMGNFLHSFENSDIIDVTDYAKYGSLNLLESTMVNGVIYGLIPIKWPEKLYAGNVGAFVVFNGPMIAENNMPDPREINENKMWTTENFTAIIPEYSIIGEENQVYSLAYHPSNFTRGFLGANGIVMVKE